MKNVVQQCIITECFPISFRGQISQGVKCRVFRFVVQVRCCSVLVYCCFVENMYSNVYSNVYSNIYSNVCSNMYSNVYSNVYSNICSNVCSNVYSNVYSNMNSNMYL